jgi:hypothetical protein
MHIKGNKKEPFSDYLRRIAINEYIREFVLLIERKHGRTLRVSHLGEAQHMQELLHIPENTAGKSCSDIQTGEYFWGEQKVIFIPSNLGVGRGFRWYFVCNGCRRKAKYLYEYSMLQSPLCRHCCRLPYQQPSRKARDLSRAIRKPYLSSETKYMLIKRAGITMEDVTAAAVRQFNNCN